MPRRFARPGGLCSFEVFGVLWSLLAIFPFGPAWACADERPDPARAERRAVAYLVREVPLWSRENHCFSCHNNGDAARALLAARERGDSVPTGALSETLDFLVHPDRWDRNGVDAAFSDKRLARLQFANALGAAVDARAVTDRAAFLRTAQRLVDDQASDGSWPMDEAALIGSPATYGTPLATALARRTLLAANSPEFADPIARAGRWLSHRPVRNLLDSSSILIGLGPAEVSDDLRKRCLDLIQRGEAPDGGWGPFANAPPEAFDTAITLLALSRWADPNEVAPLIGRGRTYLAVSQADDGSWPETTRPTGGESYAQRLSTTGWATLALIATDRSQRAAR